MMQHLSTVEQLRCAGVVTAVTIPRSALPNRLEHEQGLDRCMCLEKSFARKSRASEDIQKPLSMTLKSVEAEKHNKVIEGFMCHNSRPYFGTGSLEFSKTGG